MKTTWKELSAAQQELLLAAQAVRERAYAPYSQFLVGAAARTQDGRLIVGANLENASYGLSLCAEATCLGQVLSTGDYCVVEMAVVGGPRLGGGSRVTPCGRCRQLLAEAAQVAGRDIPVLCGDPGLGDLEVWAISELLPCGFSLPKGSP